MGTIGAVDDLAKSRTHGRGLSRRQKLISQTMVAALVAVGLDTYLNTTPNPWFIAISSVVLIATSNAVNLTDGLDGLAAGCASWAGAGLAVVAWLSVAEDPSFGEIVVIASSLVGASLGFVRFNRWPAQMFMGDTGALALGGVLGYLAIVSQHQGLWMLVGAVFIVETLSVIVQIAWFRATGRRVLRCAPLHHHFQFMGWPEPTIVRRLCAVAAVCALTAVGLSHLTHHRAQTSVQSMAAAHVQHPVR
jgi:phospho-N-acetylmuramoyl-pentapeptide-transferase